MAHRTAFRQGAALLACTLLLGCGGGSGAVGGGSGGPSAASGRERFGGLYEGQRLPADSTASSTCRGRARAVRFEVEDGIIEMRSSNRRAVGNRRKAELWGAVSTDGQVSMRPASGKRAVVGRIEGDRLTATDTQDPQTVAQVAAQGGRAPCLYRYEATRVGPRSAAGGGGDAAAAGSPPVERFPQP